MQSRHWLAIMVMALTVFSTGCETESEPKIGPNGSWWVGGADGGVFVLVKEDANPDDDLYSGTIWFDQDQSLWYEGPLRLVGKPTINPDDRDQYLGWDGERLYLEGGAWLEAVEPVPPL